MAKAVTVPTDYEAYFEVKIPSDLVYMPNVLVTFARAIPAECHAYCTSRKFPNTNKGERQAILQAYVEERLGSLADYEYRAWINGQQPFVTPRELQLWRLRNYVQYIWYWNLADDEDLAMIFNLTARKAANLASDFIARFRKTIIYPVALRRLYHLINTVEPEQAGEKHSKGLPASGSIYRIPSARFVVAAQYLVDDIRLQLPAKRMASPYLWDREVHRMWIDTVSVDVIKTDKVLQKLFYDMYKIPAV